MDDTIPDIALQTKKHGDRASWKKGCKIYYWFAPFPINNEPSSGEGGWENLHVLTSYGSDFQVWVNNSRLLVLAYLQGDFRLIECQNEHLFDIELDMLKRLHEERPLPMSDCAAP